jgi:hypothetical protein
VKGFVYFLTRRKVKIPRITELELLTKTGKISGTGKPKTNEGRKNTTPRSEA